MRAAHAGRALLLEKPLALTVEAADRLVEAVRAPTVVFFTARFDPGVSEWFETEVQSSDWHGGSAVFLSSIFTPGNPFGESQWRRDRGALWDDEAHQRLDQHRGKVSEVEGLERGLDLLRLDGADAERRDEVQTQSRARKIRVLL